MKKNFDFYEANFYFEKAGHNFYNFQIAINNEIKYLNKTFDNYSYLSNEKGDDFFQLVTNEEYKSTNSLQGGIIYQILVDRFCRVGEVKNREPLKLRDDWGGKIKKYTTDPVKLNTEVFGGNLSVVISKLSYLKELGVTAIYFNPICQANSHHKYDTADYMKIDDMYGTEEEFKILIKKAKSLDIKIIIDGVYNHTGSDSIYFNKENRFESVGAYNSKNSKYYSWYNFKNNKEEYDSWWGIKTLPSIKKDCRDFQEFIAGKNGVIEKFMEMGVFGIRLDVVDELTDEFTKKISNKIMSYNQDAVIMGEVWEDASTKISYDKRRKYFKDNELNSVMNYPLKEAIINYLKTKNPRELNSTIRMLLNNYPKIVLDNLMNSLGTHDTNRIYTEIKSFTSDEEISKSLLKIAFILLFTLPGVPTIFYGDEYGMENNDSNPRGCFDWKNYENDIYKFIKKLSKIRNYKSLKDGEIKILCCQDGKFAFERIGENEQIIVLVNLGRTMFPVKQNGKFFSFFSQKERKNICLMPNEFEILISQKND